MLGVAQDDRIAKLSNAQCDCLRLVAENRSSKEIARLLAVSPHTVDQRLKRATSILAVGSRFEAARLFASHIRVTEASPSVYDELIYQSPELTRFADLGDMNGPPDELDPLGDGDEETTLHEAQASYFSMFESEAKPRTLLSILSDARYENDLPTSWRLLAVMAIMLGGVVAFAALVSVAEGLSRIY